MSIFIEVILDRQKNLVSQLQFLNTKKNKLFSKKVLQLVNLKVKTSTNVLCLKIEMIILIIF